MTFFYYPDGKILSKGEYRDNKKKEDGNFMERMELWNRKVIFINDLPNGMWTWYYPDQSIKRTEMFLNGKEDGEYFEYDKTGKIITKGVFVEGEKKGVVLSRWRSF
jgi:antitoxin component YwqK of YwqJK toxin-antitoxin module